MGQSTPASSLDAVAHEVTITQQALSAVAGGTLAEQLSTASTALIAGHLEAVAQSSRLALDFVIGDSTAELLSAVQSYTQTVAGIAEAGRQISSLTGSWRSFSPPLPPIKPDFSALVTQPLISPEMKAMLLGPERPEVPDRVEQVDQVEPEVLSLVEQALRTGKLQPAAVARLLIRHVDYRPGPKAEAGEWTEGVVMAMWLEWQESRHMVTAEAHARKWSISRATMYRLFMRYGLSKT